jgi:signal transduction histidine kinase
VRDGRLVAVVAHDPGSVDLGRAIGAAARLAVDNERLQAEALAQVRELRASRERIVETGDAERRRLEQNLHDGAQHGLLALSYELRLAVADDDPDVAAAVAAAGEQLRLALDELRELAHGIHPAILTQAGLLAALTTFAEDAPLALELDARAGERYPATVETAAYRVVVDGVQDAARSGASRAQVRVVAEADRLVVEVRDDRAHRAPAAFPVADRVGALGGDLEIRATGIRAEIPCA